MVIVKEDMNSYNNDKPWSVREISYLWTEAGKNRFKKGQLTRMSNRLGRTNGATRYKISRIRLFAKGSTGGMSPNEKDSPVVKILNRGREFRALTMPLAVSALAIMGIFHLSQMMVNPRM